MQLADFLYPNNYTLYLPINNHLTYIRPTLHRFDGQKWSDGEFGNLPIIQQ